MTLDLHGLHVDEAVAALKRVIEDKEKGKKKSVTLSDMCMDNLWTYFMLPYCVSLSATLRQCFWTVNLTE